MCAVYGEVNLSFTLNLDPRNTSHRRRNVLKAWNTRLAIHEARYSMGISRSETTGSAYEAAPLSIFGFRSVGKSLPSAGQGETGGETPQAGVDLRWPGLKAHPK